LKSSPSTADRIAQRCSALDLEVPRRVIDVCATYYELLWRWNETINLTSLDDSDIAIDRLLVEPFAAARLLERGGHLVDIGSGGGSPAIPLAVALGVERLTMIESRGRKAAFLREVVRSLGLPATVESDRAEALVSRDGIRASADRVSIRAVRITDELSDALRRMLKNSGELLVFGRVGDLDPPGFTRTDTQPLFPHGGSVLHRLTPSS
jgi:16S rRNA (guanine527-N7)-methyltransferase